MTDEIAERTRKHKQLEEEKKRLYEDLVMALNKQKRVSEELQKSNKELEEYIKNLEDTVEWFLVITHQLFYITELIWLLGSLISQS